MAVITGILEKALNDLGNGGVMKKENFLGILEQRIEQDDLAYSLYVTMDKRGYIHVIPSGELDEKAEGAEAMENIIEEVFRYKLKYRRSNESE